jgi:hypothetical protein
MQVALRFQELESEQHKPILAGISELREINNPKNIYKLEDSTIEEFLP